MMGNPFKRLARRIRAGLYAFRHPDRVIYGDLPHMLLLGSTVAFQKSPRSFEVHFYDMPRITLMRGARMHVAQKEQSHD
jgi:hypothetical protein